MNGLKERILAFLYKKVSENKIPMIRKGLVEDFEQFVLLEISNLETTRITNNWAVKTANLQDETPSTVSSPLTDEVFLNEEDN